MPTIVLCNVKAAQTEIASVSLWSIWELTILNTEYILWPGILSNFCSLSCLTLENITIIIKSSFQMRKLKPRGIKVTPQRSGRAGIRIQFCLNPECNPDSLLSQHSVGITCRILSKLKKKGYPPISKLFHKCKLLCLLLLILNLFFINFSNSAQAAHLIKQNADLIKNDHFKMSHKRFLTWIW